MEYASIRKYLKTLKGLEILFCFLTAIPLIFLWIIVGAFVIIASLFQPSFVEFFLWCILCVSQILSLIIFPNILLYSQGINIWENHNTVQKKVHQRMILKLYLISVALQSPFIILLTSVFGLYSWNGINKKLFSDLGAVIFTGGGPLLLTLYCLQFFRPTLRKRIIFDCVFFPAVIGWYVFLVRAVF